MKLQTSAIVQVQNSYSVTRPIRTTARHGSFKNRDDFYAERLPNADDILLVIEVADSSLEYDRETKLIGKIRG